MTFAKCALLASAAAMACGLSIAQPAKAADPASVSYTRIAAVTVPGNPLAVFDISWVDTHLGVYLLADRSNSGVDIISLKTNTFLGRVGGFVGVSPMGNDHSGPDGVLTVGTQIWAGDGNSDVKIIDLPTMTVIATVNTGGTARADEMAYDPDDAVVVVANDADTPPYVSFISTAPSHKILGTIKFPEATNGLEQSVYDPKLRVFTINVPQAGPNVKHGQTVVLDPRTMKRVTAYTVHNCQPTGGALGKRHALILGCDVNPTTNVANPTQIIDDRDGDVLAKIPNVGGSDEVWYNPGDNRFYLSARSDPTGPVLGVVDGTSYDLLAKVPTAPNAHSVAADPRTNYIYVPLTPLSNDPACPQGCIGIYASSKSHAN